MSNPVDLSWDYPKKLHLLYLMNTIGKQKWMKVMNNMN